MCGQRQWLAQWGLLQVVDISWSCRSFKKKILWKWLKLSRRYLRLQCWAARLPSKLMETSPRQQCVHMTRECYTSQAVVACSKSWFCSTPYKNVLWLCTYHRDLNSTTSCVIIVYALTAFTGKKSWANKAHYNSYCFHSLVSHTIKAIQIQFGSHKNTSIVLLGVGRKRNVLY